MAGYEYYVVLCSKTGPKVGTITFSMFKDKKQFDAWYTDEIKSEYGIVAEGVTYEQALKLCTSDKTIDEYSRKQIAKAKSRTIDDLNGLNLNLSP